MAQNLCGYTQEQIVKMICAIKEICEKNYCEECPFGIGGNCGIHEHGCPADWNYNFDNTWRVFL